VKTERIRQLAEYVMATYPRALSRTEHLKRLGQDLASVVGKPAPWSRTYVSTAIGGTFSPGKRAGALFCGALEQLARSIKDETVPAFLQLARTADVMTWPDNELAGSFVMADAIQCARERCTVRFVPNVPWRRYCPAHSPMAGRDGRQMRSENKQPGGPAVDRAISDATAEKDTQDVNSDTAPSGASPQVVGNIPEGGLHETEVESGGWV
jgi:hypothetical protein